MKKIKIFITDEYPVIRQGIKALFAEHPGFVVVGEAEDGAKAVEGVVELKPDVVIMEISMPALDGIEAARRIMRRLPGVKVIIFSMHNERQLSIKALQAGVRGYVLKESLPEELLNAVDSVMAGRRFISTALTESLLNDYFLKAAEEVEPFDTLSQREREVFGLIVQGGRAKDLADRLFVSVSTVKKHKSNIIKKLKVRGTAGLIRVAIRKGVINDLHESPEELGL